ncbi:unnamed protein product [Notodromas monacha]|uniref:STAR protein homodimerisation region domain-containing protein n=1 Tax=Notodromas monacha TaxID=399045 RepID=A0A7R9BSN1_9CRUS|nr:unnamed protein product [Notodromas monacha]CAG0920992.1 unnamed protein product [Notodromas monacha]
MGENNTNNNPHSIADYLAQLLKDRKQLGAFPNVFLHVERLLDEAIFSEASEELWKGKKVVLLLDVARDTLYIFLVFPKWTKGSDSVFSICGVSS